MEVMRSRIPVIHMMFSLCLALLLAPGIGVFSSYAADTGFSVQIPVKLTFDGSSLPEETFRIELAGESLEEPQIRTVTLSAGKKSGQTAFDLMLKEGVYSFGIRELRGDSYHITYSDKEYSFYVSVHSDGRIQTSIIEKDSEDKPSEIIFDNSYLYKGDTEISTDPPIYIVKKISGSAPSEESEFVFEMTAEKPDHPLPAGKDAWPVEIRIKGEGRTETGRITFTEPGIYRYYVKEKDGGIDGYNYDPVVFTVTHTVTQDQKGKFALKTEIVSSYGDPVSECCFDNYYAKSKAAKTLNRIKRGVNTGDPAVMWPLTAVFCVSVIAISLMAAGRRKRNKKVGQG